MESDSLQPIDPVTGVTVLQEAFAQAKADGLNNTDAYKAAGYSYENMLPATATEEACKLAASPNVATRIQLLRAAIQAPVDAKRAWDRQCVIEEAAINLDKARLLNQIAPANGALGIIVDVQGLKVSKMEHTGTVGLHVTTALSLEQLEALAAGAQKLQDSKGIVDVAAYLVEDDDDS